MRSRTSHVVGTLILSICLICPILEMFDNWDHTLQTGNDTEYTFVLLALCVGMAHSFARFIFKCSLLGSVARSVFTTGVQKLSLYTQCSFTSLIFDEISPPTLALRI
jgi:hypothetical protein